MAPSFPIEFTGQRESKKCSQTGLHQMMGKSRKVSKGYSSGFVPDYRHAVETMAESEGFGSSGRVDTEITASEDSCAPQRKCISLNVDSYDRFGVPVQVLSLSKMTGSERKDLEMRLKRELQQIRALQKKVSSLGSNVTDTSPASDFHSCSTGQKRPLPDTFQRSASVGLPVSQGKKRAPPGKNGARTKRPMARVDPVNPVKQGPMPQVSTNAMIMKQCEALLNRLMQHQHAWVFNTPVDVVKLNIPDYYNVIEHPMDLGTVKLKLASGEYLNAVSFAADVRLTFKNAMTYNPKGNDVHYMAETLSKYFEVRWKPIEKKLPLNVYTQPVKSLDGNPMPPAKRTKVTSAKNIARQEQQPVKLVMSAADKGRLSSELEALLGELPESIIDFLKDSTFSDGQEEEIEIDFEALSDDTLFMLRKLLDDYMAGKQKNQAKAETCEMEIHNDSGFSNSSVQPPCKGNETLDEDVDIGGNDLPISSFPPVEIEKDAAAPPRNNSKCSSSSSSSSESGSSSSDSDSASSSGSESGGAKASAPVNSAKETLDSGANLEHRKTDQADANVGTHPLNELNQGEELESQSKSRSKPTVSVEGGGDGHQEGESAPSERQVSPDKLYRAALLRNRFADTILKAQEKAIAKDEKQDPERLKLEKQELERRRREEKARLQAEAKAAEEARKKAEADAAAEAKRKRELDREAARLALQKMEKTVDINENSQFMEDLEMLRVAQPENIHSLMIDETTPDDEAQDGGGGLMGSFKFQGNSNPLEQLGLFMKADDDDEEGEPQNVQPTADEPEEDGDAEEGEID